MEAIEYNGINLRSLETLRYHRQHIRDASGNYMMTRTEVELYASYQPSQTSYVAGATPVAAVGQFPGDTDLAILGKLLTPRGILKITSGGAVIMNTPHFKPNSLTRYLTDVQNGPFCEFVSVPKQIGNKHWLVHLRFLTHNVECTNTTSLIISNTWSTVWDVNELWYPTKTVSGTAVLRTDRMRDQHFTADDFRANFFFAIPNNYVRENIHVNLAEDGSTLNYSFTDSARCYNIATASWPRLTQIRKFEVYKTSRSDSGTPARARQEYLLAQRMAAIGTPTGIIGAGYTSLHNFLSFGGAEEGRRLANLPAHVLNIRADLWGDRDASISDLSEFCLSICLQNAVLSSVPFSLTQAEVMVRQEISDRFVSAEITYKWADNLRPGAGINTQMGADQGGGAVLLNSIFTDYPAINGRAPGVAGGVPQGTVYTLLTQTTGSNPAQAQNAFGVLSGSLFQLSVVQALQTPCQAVPEPSLTGNKS